MYGVPDALCSLEQHQLVYALLIADMAGVRAAAEQALQTLRKAADSPEGLSGAAVEVLTNLHAWPACLLQLLDITIHKLCSRMIPIPSLEKIKAADTGGRAQRLLLAVFGDLEQAWADTQLQQRLLALPLAGMQLLLSSDRLRVASEDTVLFVVRQYSAQQSPLSYGSTSLHSEARQALAPLLRAPQLSMFALSSIPDLDTYYASFMLSDYLAPLKLLTALRRVTAAESPELLTQVRRIPSVPASWLLGPRQIKQLTNGVQLEWRLPVEQLKQACRDSHKEKSQY
jgi:hypothetical protein